MRAPSQVFPGLSWVAVLATMLVHMPVVASPPIDEPAAADRLVGLAIDTKAGADRRIVNARTPPYRAIGKLTGSMACTAAIVLHPRIVLTAAHCVTGNMSTLGRPGLLFRPAYQGGIGLGVFEARIWAMGSAQQLGEQSLHDASRDWAILLLKEKPADIRPLRLSSYTAGQLKSLRGGIVLPSYSFDMAKAQALSVDPSCSVRDAMWEVLVHDCEAAAGASGAPLLVRDDVWYAVVGIHSGAMLVDDGEHRPARPIGNSAISVERFAASLRQLLMQLDAEDDTEGVHALVF